MHDLKMNESRKEKPKKCSHVILCPRSMVRISTFTINLIGHSSSFRLKFSLFFFAPDCRRFSFARVTLLYPFHFQIICHNFISFSCSSNNNGSVSRSHFVSNQLFQMKPIWLCLYAMHYLDAVHFSSFI